MDHAREAVGVRRKPVGEKQRHPLSIVRTLTVFLVISDKQTVRTFTVPRIHRSALTLTW